MLNINNYIQEKLHIGKDSKSKINFDELYESLLEFFKKHFKPEEFKLDKRILNNIQRVIFESGNYKALTKTDALLDDLSDYIDNTIKIDCDIEDHRYNTFLTIHIIPKDDSITEKLHIGKDTKNEIDARLYLPLSSEKIIDMIYKMLKDNYPSVYPNVNDIDIEEIREIKNDGGLKFYIRISNPKTNDIGVSLFSSITTNMAKKFNEVIKDYKTIGCSLWALNKDNWVTEVSLYKKL